MSVSDVFATPNADIQDIAGGEGLFTDSITTSLRKTRPWVLFLAILGFISAVLMGITTIPMFLGMGDMMNVGASSGVVMGMGLFYLAIAVVTFMASLHLLKFAGSIKQALSTLTAQDLEQALAHQASFWKLVGILSLISMIFMVVAIIGVAFLAVNTAGVL